MWVNVDSWGKPASRRFIQAWPTQKLRQTGQFTRDQASSSCGRLVPTPRIRVEPEMFSFLVKTQGARMLLQIPVPSREVQNMVYFHTGRGRRVCVDTNSDLRQGEKCGS